MGGGRKKKFIDKKAATTYNVVHRSQQDGAFGLEDRPSERVLLAQAPVNAARRARVTRAGFADDGYDYERHLRAGGGGVFVNADGSVSKAAALPPEALPGEQELERAVEAVTLDDRLMDADVRDALFDDAAFEDCEELLDDFVIDASRPAADEPEEFDFDAHVARLIAAAEGAGDEDEDEDDASFDAAPPRAHAADDAAFDAALADWSSDDDDDDEDDEDDLDAGRIRLDDGAVLGAMLDEAIGGQAPPGDAAFLDPPPRDRQERSTTRSRTTSRAPRTGRWTRSTPSRTPRTARARRASTARPCSRRSARSTTGRASRSTRRRPRARWMRARQLPSKVERRRGPRRRRGVDGVARDHGLARRGESAADKKARTETKAADARRAAKKETKLAWKSAARGARAARRPRHGLAAGLVRVRRRQEVFFLNSAASSAWPRRASASL